MKFKIFHYLMAFLVPLFFAIVNFMIGVYISESPWGRDCRDCFGCVDGHMFAVQRPCASDTTLAMLDIAFFAFVGFFLLALMLPVVMFLRSFPVRQASFLRDK